MRKSLHCLLLILPLWLCQQAHAIECSSPTLKGATGVIGNKHIYKITGSCSYTWSETEQGIGSSKTTTGALSFSYTGSVSWDRQTGEAIEKLDIAGDSVGKRAAVANCTQDPFLKDPPGGPAQCGPVKVQAEIKSGGIYKLLLKGQFWAAKKLSLAEAQALSALPPPSQSPSPKTPASKPVASARSMPADASVGGVAAAGTMGSGAASAGVPPQDAAGRAVVIEQMQRNAGARATTMDLRPTQMEIEGEALVTSGAFQIRGGQARVQQMSGFGNGWSGGAQLFWSEGAPGAVLDLLIDVPAASKYALEIYMTRAPDFGKLQFEIDGKPSDVPFDGMAPDVMTSGPIQLGTFPLQAGQRRVSLMIIGKYAQSTGYHAGIDKLRLYPAGPID